MSFFYCASSYSFKNIFFLNLNLNTQLYCRWLERTPGGDSVTVGTQQGDSSNDTKHCVIQEQLEKLKTPHPSHIEGSWALWLLDTICIWQLNFISEPRKEAKFRRPRMKSRLTLQAGGPPAPLDALWRPPLEGCNGLSGLWFTVWETASRLNFAFYRSFLPMTVGHFVQR